MPRKWIIACVIGDTAGLAPRLEASDAKARLRRDERRRVEAALDAPAAADSLADLLTVTLAAVDEYLGYSMSAFMLAIATPPLPGERVYAGTTRGFKPSVLEEYFECWASRDPLASEAGRLSFLRDGRVALADIYRTLDRPRRRFVDDFLRRIQAPHQLSYRLPVGWTDGYLTVMGAAEHTERDKCLLGAFAPGLAELLQALLPRGRRCGLTRREAQVTELVTLGFSNPEIAGVLCVEEDTVKKHVSRAMDKVGVRRRSALAVVWATGHSLEIRPVVQTPRRSDPRSAGAAQDSE